MRSKKNNQLGRYVPIADAVSKLFAPHVEVVIHDSRTQSIFHIANCFSRRKVGESSTGEQAPIENAPCDVIGPYRKVNHDGRHLRSITAVIRDDAGREVGYLCINFDVSKLQNIASDIASLAFLPGGLEPHAPLFHSNWRQVLEAEVELVERQEGLAARSFSRAARIHLIGNLKQKGIVTVRHSSSIIAERLGISRAAYYKYLKSIERVGREVASTPT